MKITKFTYSSEDPSNNYTQPGVSIRGCTLEFQRFHKYRVTMTIDTQGGYLNGTQSKKGHAYISYCSGGKFFEKEAMEFLKEHSNDLPEISAFIDLCENNSKTVSNDENVIMPKEESNKSFENPNNFWGENGFWGKDGFGGKQPERKTNNTITNDNSFNLKF
jgi:hypothetical protein